MPSYDVTFLEQKRITVWIPEGASDGQKQQLALDHLAMLPGAGNIKLHTIVPTPDLDEPK